MKENEISKVIVNAVIEVHRELGGPGLVSEFNAEPQRNGLTSSESAALLNTK